MNLNIISLIVIALAGVAVFIYAVIERNRKEKLKPPQDPTKEDSYKQIKSKLLFEIPIEKILLVYFVMTALVYTVKLILGTRIPGLDLAVMYLSGLAFFLASLKMMLALVVAKKFSPWLLLSVIFSLLIVFVIIQGISVDVIDFLAATREHNLTIHLFGMAMGLGGIFINDIIFSHFIKDYSIKARESVVMHLISQMIFLGLALLLLSGLALYLPTPETYLENPRFLMKMTVVLVLILNGAALNRFVIPKMKKISVKEEDQGRYELLNKAAFAMALISLFSWISAFLLARLKELFDLPYLYLLLGYLVLLAIAVLLSQYSKKQLEEEEKEGEKIMEKSERDGVEEEDVDETENNN